VLLANDPTQFEAVNDLDSDLMLFWRILRDQPEALARACALTPHSRAERDVAHDQPAQSQARPAGVGSPYLGCTPR
jgi:DNA adenine methylase